MLIVNADDYGMNENATKAILECFERGLLTNSTMIVNSEYSEVALSLAKEMGICGQIGLHVNLMQGRPLTDAMRMNRTFCDASGNFTGLIGRRGRRYQRFWMRKDDVIAAGLEIRAQMELFRKMGFLLNHFDSHIYSNTYLPLLPIYLICAKEFGFETTRGMVNTTADGKSKKMSILRSLYSRHVYAEIRKSGMKTADYLGYAWDIVNICSRASGEFVFELHCHPNYRASDDRLSMDGELKDWKTPYNESFALIKNVLRDWRVIDFAGLAKEHGA